MIGLRREGRWFDETVFSLGLFLCIAEIGIDFCSTMIWLCVVLVIALNRS